MSFARRLILGNWRNKGVALFFAVTLWFVAYQSEKQEFSAVVRVDLEPAASGPTPVSITSEKRVDPQTGASVDFDGHVRLVFSGPRKQVNAVRDAPPSYFRISVPRGTDVYAFQPSDFGYPAEGVQITEFSPESVRITQEEVVTVNVKNLADKLVVTHFKDGYEVATKDVVPSSVQLTGPKSIVDSLGVSLQVSMDYVRERFEGKVDVNVTRPDEIPAEAVKRAVRVKPPEARVSVVLQASTDVLAVDAVRVTFRVPPVKAPIKIVLDDVVGDTIPVEFYGPKDEVARLRERLRDQPGFSVGVRVPAFDRMEGGQFTFTEDSLELFGFPGVQIRQHESRRKEKKTAWSYSVVPVKEGEKPS